jgi:hypothetical protein
MFPRAHNQSRRLVFVPNDLAATRTKNRICNVVSGAERIITQKLFDLNRKNGEEKMPTPNSV